MDSIKHLADKYNKIHFLNHNKNKTWTSQHKVKITFTF